MTVKEQAHILVDQLPERATWDDLLRELQRAARGRNREAEEASDRETRKQALRRFLEEKIWAAIPPEALDRSMNKAEREEILGYPAERSSRL